MKKETYKKTETIEMKVSNFTEDDLKIFKRHNTCGYLYYGRYSDNKDKYPSGYPNITNKKTCFNADQFKELKNLVDCGYAEMTFTVKNVKKTIKTCFYIPNNKMPNEVGLLLNNFFLERQLKNNICFLLYEYFGISTPITYEVIVEDKNKKKVKYTSDSYEIVVLEKGNNSSRIKLNIFLILSLLLMV